MLLLLALSWSAVTAASSATGASRDRVFYVAPWGRDSNSGLSRRHPWRTVWHVNNAALRPGDTVLFEGGKTFKDDTLMPGWGFNVSGTAWAPIKFGSWGRGKARLPRGVWLGTNAFHPHGPSHLWFNNLALGPTQGFQGTGDFIVLTGLSVSHLRTPRSNGETGIETRGSNWVIAWNRVSRVGDSGILLGFSADRFGAPAGGSGYLVYGNVITHTGEDSSIHAGSHGIYDKVTNATIERNWIMGFRDDGVSVRYHSTQVLGNYIRHGSIGIAWYQ